jgi:hypothetical protein
VDAIHQCGIHLHAGTDRRVCEACANIGAVGPAVDALLEMWVVILRVRILDMCLQLRVLPGKVQAAPEQIPR